MPNDVFPSANTYDHVYIAPHLDDAALSCGGAIARQVADGDRVVVVNVCSGAPPLDAPLSPFAQAMHERWALPADAVLERRLREDASALAILGADSRQLDLLDAIYRVPTTYNSESTLFGDIYPADSLFNALGAHLRMFAQRLPNAQFYAPLGVGNHVDHQVVHAVASQLAAEGRRVAFYEDVPYVTVDKALQQRLAALGGTAGFTASTLDIDATLETKIRSIEAYVSQIGVLFGSVARMAQTITAYAASLRPTQGTHGERLWVRR